MEASHVPFRGFEYSGGLQMNVLITGGAGYIGSHTAKVMASSTITPVVLDNLCNGHRWAVCWGPFVEGNLSDRELLRNTIKRYSIEAVIHFAGFAYVGESMLKPELYFENNLLNTFNLLEAMRVENVRHIVFSSSCATYGMPKHFPISEDEPQSPVNPYGESKLAVEKMLGWYGKIHGLSWASLRYFNAAGADPDGGLGEAHDPETHLVPLVISAALGRVPEVQVYGTNYETVDGTAVRDYVHVTDLGSAHLAALRYLLDGGESAAFNLGTGSGRSVREIISTTEMITGRKVPVRICGPRPGDPPVLVANVTRAADVLQWRPQYSALESIIETAWQWHRKGVNLSTSQRGGVI